MNRWILTWVCISLGVLAWAAPAGRDMAREAQIEQELARLDPSQVEPFRAGRIAMDKGDAAEAARLYAQVCRQVPGFDAAARRLGNNLVHQGQREEGLSWCRKAVTLKRSMENLSTLATCLVFQEGHEASIKEQEEALQLLLECRRLPRGGELDVLFGAAHLSLKLKHYDDFKEVAAALRQGFPELMQAHYFAAIAAAMDEHWIRSEREIRLAGKLGLPKEAVQEFLDSGVGSRATGWFIALYALLGVAAWVAGLGLLFALGFTLSKVTMHQAEKRGSPDTISSTEHQLRRVYRMVLNISGVYYYVSLPIVMVLVIGVSGAILFGFMALGWLPIKLMLILGIGALMTIWAMGKSLFLRVAQEDPGRPLERQEAEGLWTLVEEVAQTLGTRPIDEIRITTGTDLAVYEKGSWREKLQNRARRILILGTAVLPGFQQDDFRCVLAHEYGHFSHRDTAGGDIALRVRSDMVKFYVAMCQAGQATYSNVAFHFLRFYNFLFRRISHGATRLQEILADRVAAQTYGALALEGGLRHVIRRSLEFETCANQEIKAAIDARRTLQNLYEASLGEGDSVASDFEKALNRATTEDDTHPSPMDRFRLVSRFTHPVSEPRSGEVWGLFRDPQAITQEMMARLEERVSPYRSVEDASRKASGPV